MSAATGQVSVTPFRDSFNWLEVAVAMAMMAFWLETSLSTKVPLVVAVPDSEVLPAYWYLYRY